MLMNVAANSNGFFGLCSPCYLDIGACPAIPCAKHRIRCLSQSRLPGPRDEFGAITTLGNRMTCGLGKCGRCTTGRVYVCKDGPGFTATERGALPPDM
jgi:hypothetical protein